VTRIEPVKPAAKYSKSWRTKKNSAIAGIAIVVVSVVGINFAIKTLSGSHEFVVADAAAPAGTPLSELPTRTISLNLGAAEANYVQPGFASDDLVLSQPVAPGELIVKRNLEQLDPSHAMVRMAISAKTVCA